MTVADKTMILMRRRVREADDVALLNRRAYGTYRSMKKDAEKCNRLVEIDFSLEDLRAWARELRGTFCKWCQRLLKANNISWDHETPVSRGGLFSKSNLAGICSVCNGQKGSLRREEFSELRNLLSTFAPVAKADVLRRLGLGARWRS